MKSSTFGRGLIQIIFVFSGTIRNYFVVEEHASGGGVDSPPPTTPVQAPLCCEFQSIKENREVVFYGVNFIVATCALVFPRYGFLGSFI